MCLVFYEMHSVSSLCLSKVMKCFFSLFTMFSVCISLALVFCEIMS